MDNFPEELIIKVLFELLLKNISCPIEEIPVPVDNLIAGLLLLPGCNPSIYFVYNVSHFLVLVPKFTDETAGLQCLFILAFP